MMIKIIVLKFLEIEVSCENCIWTCTLRRLRQSLGLTYPIENM